MFLDYTKSGTIVLVRHEITCNSLAAKRRVREMFTLVARAAYRWAPAMPPKKRVPPKRKGGGRPSDGVAAAGSSSKRVARKPKPTTLRAAIWLA